VVVAQLTILLGSGGPIDEEAMVPGVKDQGNLYMDFSDIEGAFAYNNATGRVFIIKGHVIRLRKSNS
jgi:hypothetical protein